VGPGEGVKPRLSQALTRGARPDSNSRPAVQIPNPLPSRYAPWGPKNHNQKNEDPISLLNSFAFFKNPILKPIDFFFL